MRYVIFSRVSTSKQITENQMFECRNYVNSVKKDGDQVFEFEEHATTTKLSMQNRPVLQEMLNFLLKGDTLVIYKLTRVARKGRELVDFYDDYIEKKGVILKSIFEPNVDDMFIHAFAMIGEMERKNIQTFTRTSLARKREGMEKVGSCHYGYKTDPNILQSRPHARSTGKPYLLIPDKAEMEIVDIMHNLHQQGHGYGTIARMLNEKGFRNRSGNSFQKMTIHRVVNRKCLAG